MSMTTTTCADGLLIVDKPQGVTSFDAVAAVRAALHTKKVGHAGTLDPMATGMLVIGFGRATRLLQYIVEHDKTYEATIRLGLATTTDDAEGDIIAPDTAARDDRTQRSAETPAGMSFRSRWRDSSAESLDGISSSSRWRELSAEPLDGISFRSRWRELSAEPTEGGHSDASDDDATSAARLRAIIESTIAERFTGDIEQIPNTFSAIKIDGQRAYDLARAGKDVALKARPVHIAEFTVLAMHEGLASTSDPTSPLQSAPVSCSHNGTSPLQSTPTSRSRNGADAPQLDPTSRSRWRELSAQPTEGGPEGGPKGDPEHKQTESVVPVIDVDVRVSCSSGTYIRALARDLGEALGVGGYLTRLRRTRVGRFALSDDRSGLAQVTVLPAVTDTGIDDDTTGIGETATEAAETAMQAIAAHIEPKTFTNRDGETVTRNRCVLDTPGDARGDWLRARAVGMADAARGAMPVVDITADEARELRFGRRIDRELEKGVHYAAIVPETRGGIGNAAGAVVPADVAAIIERANRTQAKPSVVFPAA